MSDKSIESPAERSEDAAAFSKLSAGLAFVYMYILTTQGF